MKINHTKKSEPSFKPGDVIQCETDGDLALVIERPLGWNDGANQPGVFVVIDLKTNRIAWDVPWSSFRLVNATLEVSS